jgi:hypothetical protein
MNALRRFPRLLLGQHDAALRRTTLLSRLLPELFMWWLIKLRHQSLDVTLVAVGRNDNYGGDFRGRLAASLSWNFAWNIREAIYVEWNPLEGKPSDAEWLTAQFPDLRVYIVPPHIHKQYCTNPNISVMEYVAKNVGIRRARTTWIAVTNGDILWGPMAAWKMWRLDPMKVYRAARVNFSYAGSLPSMWGLLCSVFSERNMNQDTMEMDPYGYNASGDFVVAHRDLWHSARGYDEQLPDRRTNCDGRGLAQLYAKGGEMSLIGFVYHMNHAESTMHNTKGKHLGEAFDFLGGVPYCNSETWGLLGLEEVQIGERIWRMD